MPCCSIETQRAAGRQRAVAAGLEGELLELQGVTLQHHARPCRRSSAGPSREKRARRWRNRANRCRRSSSPLTSNVRSLRTVPAMLRTWLPSSGAKGAISIEPVKAPVPASGAVAHLALERQAAARAGAEAGIDAGLASDSTRPSPARRARAEALPRGGAGARWTPCRWRRCAGWPSDRRRAAGPAGCRRGRCPAQRCRPGTAAGQPDRVGDRCRRIEHALHRKPAAAQAQGRGIDPDLRTGDAKPRRRVQGHGDSLVTTVETREGDADLFGQKLDLGREGGGGAGARGLQRDIESALPVALHRAAHAGRCRPRRQGRWP